MWMISLVGRKDVDGRDKPGHDGNQSSKRRIAAIDHKTIGGMV
jgi:hypothetical protein